MFRNEIFEFILNEGIVFAFLRKLLALHDSGQSAEKKNEARNRGREL